MSHRILFVDDDPSILRGVRRMLFEYEDKWEVHFAESGQKGLALFEENPFDIVVADLQMPGMDGVELLARVREIAPGTMRIVLSGYSDRSRIIASTRVAHQFLSKPSSPDAIIGTLTNLFSLYDIPLHEDIRQVVCELESLPVLPPVYDQLQHVVSTSEINLDDIGMLVMQDMGLAASVLKLVNTSFFGLPLHITDPMKAVSLLGPEAIRGLLLRDDFITRFDVERYEGVNQEMLWSHSLNTARFAEAILTMEGSTQTESEEGYTAGMLHDVGKLILAEGCVDHYSEIVRMTKEKNIPIDEAERAVLGVTHGQIGAYLLGLWGFADSVVRAASSHHAPEETGDDKHVIAVHAANALEHELVVLNDHYAPHSVNEQYLRDCGLDHRYEAWREACKQLDGIL